MENKIFSDDDEEEQKIILFLTQRPRLVKKIMRHLIGRLN